MFLRKKRKNSSKYLKMTVYSLVLLSAVIFIFPLISSAQVVVPQIDGLGTADLKAVVGTIIQIFLGLLGLIAVIIVLYAGFIWMTSGGNEEKISKAKKILSAGIIGLLIIMASYAIVAFILQTVQDATNNNGGQSGARGGFGSGLGGGALGGGVIEYHYPERDANNVPRNTMIMITFKLQVATTSIISSESFESGSAGENLCNNYTSSNTNGNECGPLSNYVNVINDGTDISDEIVAVLQADGKNVLLKPINALGNSQHSSYTQVILSADMVANDSEGSVALFGMNGYSWQFEVSTFLDLTPPQVTFVWPENNAHDIFRNAIIQMNFSEPINILSVNQNNVTSTATSYGVLSGNLKISNRYRTIEFLSDMPCGDGNEINSCGERVFCLPGNDDITTTIKSGTSGNVLSGISDAAGNMLDGNSNGSEDNTPLGNDDYKWSFSTSNTVYLDPPHIVSVEPNNSKENVQLIPDPQINAVFALKSGVPGYLSPSSLNSDNFYVYDNNSCVDLGEESTELESGWKDNIKERGNPENNTNCFPAYFVYLDTDNKRCNIKILSDLKNITLYRPRLTSKIKDSYGNCFYQANGPGGRKQQ